MMSQFIILGVADKILSKNQTQSLPLLNLKSSGDIVKSSQKNVKPQLWEMLREVHGAESMFNNRN